jgi:hypothetical protein
MTISYLSTVFWRWTYLYLDLFPRDVYSLDYYCSSVAFVLNTTQATRQAREHNRIVSSNCHYGGDLLCTMHSHA